MRTIPYFDPVTVEEAVAYADNWIALSTRDEGFPVSAWVRETNEKRAKAKAEWQAAPIELPSGVTVKPGDVVTLTVKPRYGKEHRIINCLIVDRFIEKVYDYDREVRLRFVKFGAKPEVWAREQHVPLHTIVSVQDVKVTPAFAALIAEREARLAR